MSMPANSFRRKFQTLKIHEVTTVDQFFELRNCWNDVLERSKDNSLFLTWEHIAVSVKNLSGNQKLKILYVTIANKIVAIAPLRQSNHFFYGLFQYRVIEPLDYGSATDYTGLILAEQETECLRIFLKYLYGKDDWDFFYFNDIPSNALFNELLTKNNHLFPEFEIEQGEICPYIELPDSMEYFLEGLNGNFKKNLRRSLRNLEKDFGKVELKEYSELGSLEVTMQLFFDLHQKRWISKGGPGAFSSQKIRDIFTERAK